MGETMHHSLVLLSLLLLLLLPVLQLQGCVEEEREALLHLKRRFVDSDNKLQSWNSSSSQDCCSWFGITCRGGGEGHVIHLHLSRAGLSGKMSPSLLSLKHLEELDLSFNDFQGNPIPPFIGSFPNLTSLNLSDAGFGGAIPPQLGLLRNLQHLTISNSLDSGGKNNTSSHPALYLQDFRWVSNLSSLHALVFQNVDLGRASDWELSLSKCPLLQELTLVSCNLTSFHRGGIGNLPSLSSGNGYASLRSLDLCLNHNLGKSFIPTWMFSLKNLIFLGLARCSLDGVVTQHHFGSNLISLKTLHMSNNPLLHIQIAPDWVPPFNLSSLHLSSCKVGPGFPLWLRTQESLESLLMSRAGLHDSLPTWFWGFSPSLYSLDLSHNQLYGVIPDFSLFSGQYLDLSSNNFVGQLPANLSSSSVRYLNLSHNSFSGCLSQLLCHDERRSISLEYLDLDNNLLSENMSDCWDRWTSLKFISISNNNLTGRFSNSLATLSELSSLHLRNNSLSGSLTFLEKHNWTNLITLDLGINKFNGSMKGTYQKKFSKLRFLMLDSNEISGTIPREICNNLEDLQIFNFASNNLSGIIPSCFQNFRGMKVKQETSNIVVGGRAWWLNRDDNYENLQLYLKGRVDEYNKNLGLVTHLDISNNHLSGEIPKELMNLTWLYSFNLSRNQLSGPIPMNIGNMRLLSSLDLSMNQLFGEIPSTISQVTRLDHFNVSHNHLTGRIPISTQLQSFDPSSYIGNTLCGKPLPEKCDQGDASSPTMNEHDAGDYKDDSLVGLYIGFPIGFGAGASTMFIILLFQSSWRFSFFYFIDRTLNKLF